MGESDREIGGIGGTGDDRFEDRIRALFGDGDPRAVSASAVIASAKRRRGRRRATVAGSSLAVAGVLGVAVGAVALSGGSGAQRAVMTPGMPTPTTAQQPPAAAPPKPAPRSATSTGPKTCSASVTGTTPKPEVTTDDQGLRWDTFSGAAAGIPWAIQIHVFPDAASYERFANMVPGSLPSAALGALHPGADAVFRTPGVQGWEMNGMPDFTGSPDYFLNGAGRGLGEGTPVSTKTGPGPGDVHPGPLPEWQQKRYAAYFLSGWVAPTVDHMCLQYADRAEFVPVYKVQGGTFAAFGIVTADQPHTLIGYDAKGQVIGREKAMVNQPPGMFVLVPMT